MSILDHPIINRRYFFPQSRALRNPFPVLANGFELRCHRNDGDPMLVHFHGNGEAVADWVPDFPDALAAQNIGCLFAEYRGYGGSDGSPALAGMLEDALAVVDATGLPPERIVVYGRSAGSLYAIHAAAHRRVAGLIVESGIADVGEGLGVTPAEIGATPEELEAAVATHFDHRGKVQGFGGPVLIMHTAADHLVSVRHAYRLAEWAGSEAVLRIFDQGNHNSIFALNGATVFEETIAFVQRCTGAR